MEKKLIEFGGIAKDLSRNPLGIIALFIVLVYGIAVLVRSFVSGLTDFERTTLILYITLFPVIVLIIFTWLVSQHSEKLFGPGDYKNEDIYFKTKMLSAISLALAANKSSNSFESKHDIERIISIVTGSKYTETERKENNNWKNNILWVDDNPDNNIYERRAFEAIGLNFTLAESTQEALVACRNKKFSAIISDMGRREGKKEGYVLLDEIRRNGDKTPLFFYANSNLPEHKQETLERGGQGCTNSPQELYEMVTKAIIAIR